MIISVKCHGIGPNCSKRNVILKCHLYCVCVYSKPESSVTLWHNFNNFRTGPLNAARTYESLACFRKIYVFFFKTLSPTRDLLYNTTPNRMNNLGIDHLRNITVICINLANTKIVK